MLKVTDTLSILVAAVIGRPRLCRRLGNNTAHRVIRELFCDLSCIVRNINGETMHIAEDKIMCAFASANDAVIAAATMHECMSSRPHPQSMTDDCRFLGLEIRISTGTVLRQMGELFGEPVDWAVKLKTTLVPRSTFVSETTVQYLSSEHKDLTRLVNRWTAAGCSGRQKVFEYLGFEEDITLAMDRQPISGKMATLDIVHGPVVMIMDAARPVVAIGRSADNDILIKYPRVSRKHARIEMHRDKFVLVDTSSNGTYVQIGDLDVICIRHGEIPLMGKGIICPGRQASSSSPGAIHFTLR